MASGDFYEVIDKQSQGGQTILNVFVFQVTGADATAENVALTWQADQAIQISSLQSSSLVHDNVTVNNLNDLSDFWVETLGIVGEQPGDVLPPYDCVALFYVRTTRASRNGWKRFAGVPEAHQNDGILDGTIITSWDGVAAYLLGPHSSSVATLSMVPYIWRRPKVGPPPVAQAFFPVSSIEVRNAVTTQNTRKYNRGI